MKSIRENTFETNSSSSHSISVKLTKQYNPLNCDMEGQFFKITGDEYGWSGDDCDTPWEKANYLATDAMDNADRDKIYEWIKKAFVECGGMEEKNVTFDIDESNAYIDHQSVGTAIDKYGSCYEDVKNFLFNPGIRVIIDHDNH